MYQQVIETLRSAYDQKVSERVDMPIAPWKVVERANFLARLQAEGKQSLLEIGAGPGRDSLFFQQHGLTVTCTDLSPAMVAHCRSLGLNAHVMDFANLDFPQASFDALFAQNCLLHVPKADFLSVLRKLHSLLQPHGLFFLGQYGGIDQEGIYADDHYEPKRFYARYLDDQLLALVRQVFDVVDFHAVPLKEAGAGHFQSFTLRKAAGQAAA